MARKPRVTAATRALARQDRGLRFSSPLRCLACGEDNIEAEYGRAAPLYFRCPSCGRRAAVRDEEDDGGVEGLPM